MQRYIKDLLDEPDGIIESDLPIKTRVLASTRTKAVTYRSFNPDLLVHSIYTTDNEIIMDDDLRTAFTRFRLSSHRLKIETGRWARIDPENRVCQCGEDVQSEEHVLCQCSLVNEIRKSYGCETF